MLAQRADGWVKVRYLRRNLVRLGWVRAGNVELAVTDARVEVDLSDRSLSITKDGRPPRTWTLLAVGAQATPTPTGVYWIERQVQPTGSHATTYYRVIETSARAVKAVAEIPGLGRTIAAHGFRRGPGQASHGCLRVADRSTLDTLAGLPLGTPVVIRP